LTVSVGVDKHEKNPVARVNGLECDAGVGDVEGDNVGGDRNP